MRRRVRLRRTKASGLAGPKSWPARPWPSKPQSLRRFATLSSRGRILPEGSAFLLRYPLPFLCKCTLCEGCRCADVCAFARQKPQVSLAQNHGRRDLGQPNHNLSAASPRCHHEGAFCPRDLLLLSGTLLSVPPFPFLCKCTLCEGCRCGDVCAFAGQKPQVSLRSTTFPDRRHRFMTCAPADFL
jgi:hypothetical protein